MGSLDGVRRHDPWRDGGVDHRGEGRIGDVIVAVDVGEAIIVRGNLRRIYVET